MFRVAWSLAFAVFTFPGPVHAQSKLTELPTGYPSKVVRIILGNPPGGGPDIIVRMLALQLSERWGKPVVVENRDGASGLIAMNMLAKGDPDGHLIMIGGNPLVISTVLKKIPFDMRKAYAPIVQLTSQPYLMVVHPSVPATSVKNFIAYAKNKPGGLDYGSPGVGSTAHLGMEMFNAMAGIKMQHIPYNQGRPITDLMSGRIQVLLQTVVTVMPLIKTGKLNALGVTSPRRTALLPDVPTVAETGLPGYELNSPYGLFAPAGTPAEIVSAINLHSNIIMRTPAFGAKLTADGVDVAAPNTPADYRATIEQDIARWEKFFKTPGLDVAAFQ